LPKNKKIHGKTSKTCHIKEHHEEAEAEADEAAIITGAEAVVGDLPHVLIGMAIAHTILIGRHTLMWHNSRPTAIRIPNKFYRS
jgi:hypothetical protein